MSTFNNNKYLEDDEIAVSLKTVVDHFYKEDMGTREMMIRRMKRLKYYWNNFSQVYWDESASSYRIWGTDFSNQGNGTDDQGYYDRPVNVFKAFLETIVAALSINIPSVSCSPSDADNPDDLSTAKAGDLISQKIYKDNNVILVWLQMLYVYCTEGMIACYTYPHESAEYGTYQEPKYKTEEVDGYLCPNCGTELEEDSVVTSSEEQPEICPNCKETVPTDLKVSKIPVKIPDGFDDKNKSRMCFEVFGGLYVKTALYAKSQAATPYLMLMYETHYVNALNEYTKLREKLPWGGWSNLGNTDNYEQYGRLNVQYRGTMPEENVTVKEVWLRPQSFLILDEDEYNELIEKFPDGVKVCLVNDIVADYFAEKLDDRWTLSYNPMSDYINHEPLGELLVNIQDIVNDLISLTLQIIEHGVPQTWVDPTFVDTDAYGQLEVVPGALTPTKALGTGKKIGDGFYSTSTASLSPETFQFYNIINQLGQFVSGAMPSLWGGSQPSSGDTATEYTTQKDMALQRLNTPWKMMVILWKTTMKKAIFETMKIMVTDEKLVEKDNNGNFINVFIRKSEMSGRIGDVELEASDQLPISEEQQRKIIMELMKLNSPEILSALSSPENIPMMRKIIRIPQFSLPGEDDRQKQYEEINELINSTPIPIVPEWEDVQLARLSGMEPPQVTEVPSVEIDPIVDNHQIEAEICRSWLISEAGRLCKKENEMGYKNVLLHMKMHVDEINKAMAVNSMQNEQPDTGEEKKTPAKSPEKSGAQK